ncbi:MAG: hypothetical protein ACRDKI_07435 [Solirubrobacterales bacterium]
MASKANNTRLLAIACGVAATVTLVVLLLLLLDPFGGDSGATAKADDSANTVTIDGDQVYGADSGPKTQNAALIRDPEEQYASPEPKNAKLHKIAGMPAASTTRAPAAGAQTSDQVKKLLKEQRKAGKLAPGDTVQLADDGSAIPPIGAPDAINGVVAAGNAIKNYPYIWGGGHASFQARGYDCSGSVSYALAGGGLLDAPLTSGELANWGEPGPGKYITIYANGGHVFMFVGGLRFDTSFRDGPRGSRWQDSKRSLAGFEIRHPAGL